MKTSHDPRRLKTPKPRGRLHRRGPIKNNLATDPIAYRRLNILCKGIAHQLYVTTSADEIREVITLVNTDLLPLVEAVQQAEKRYIERH